MSEEEKKAIEHLKKVVNERTISPLADEIGIALNLLSKKDKVIDLMAEDLKTDYHSKEWIIEHYVSEVNNGSRGSN